MSRSNNKNISSRTSFTIPGEIGTVVALWLGIGATLPIDKSLTLGREFF